MRQTELFYKRQLHYSYVEATLNLNPAHYNALASEFSILRSELFHHAREPLGSGQYNLESRPDPGYKVLVETRRVDTGHEC